MKDIWNSISHIQEISICTITLSESLKVTPERFKRVYQNTQQCITQPTRYLLEDRDFDDWKIRCHYRRWKSLSQNLFLWNGFIKFYKLDITDFIIYSLKRNKEIREHNLREHSTHGLSHHWILEKKRYSAR